MEVEEVEDNDAINWLKNQVVVLWRNTVFPIPELAVIQTSATVCRSHSLMIHAEGGGYAQWAKARLRNIGLPVLGRR